MKAIQQWLEQSDPATLRKLTVFAEYDADGKPTTWRACCMAGSTNGLVAYGKGADLPAALEALDDTLAAQSGQILGAYDGGADELEGDES